MRAFNEIRAIVQQPPSEEGWRRVRTITHRAWRRASDEVREQWLPYLNSHLRRWPDVLRVTMQDWTERFLSGEDFPPLQLARNLALHGNRAQSVDGPALDVRMRARGFAYITNVGYAAVRLDQAGGDWSHLRGVSLVRGCGASVLPHGVTLEELRYVLPHGQHALLQDQEVLLQRARAGERPAVLVFHRLGASALPWRLADLGYLEGVRALDLSFDEIDALAGVIERLPDTLEHVNLRGVGRRAEVLHAAALPSSLRALDLGGNSMTNAQLQALARHPQLATLERLALDGNAQLNKQSCRALLDSALPAACAVRLPLIKNGADRAALMERFPRAVSLPRSAQQVLPFPAW